VLRIVEALQAIRELAIAGLQASSYGETRTRTGDTTIFRGA
jgi:hypothetical protein